MSTPDPTPSTPMGERVLSAELSAVALAEAVMVGDNRAMLELTADADLPTVHLLIASANLTLSIAHAASSGAATGITVPNLLHGARRFALEREATTRGGDA